MNYFKDIRILIVGGAGFVGSNLVNALLREDPVEIVVVDNLLSSEPENIPKSSKINFIEGSITDESILKQIDDSFEYCFHLATYHGNQNSIYNPLKDHENNTLTTLKLYEKICQFTNYKKIVYSSAGCTVAEKTYQNPSATTEDAPVSLYFDSPYQISKIIGELYSNYYHNRYGMPVVKARFQNVYGPQEILGAGKWRGTAATIWRNVIPIFIYKALRGEDITVEGNGEATRDFIYVGDIVEGLMKCAVFGINGEVYNLASGEETSIRELAEKIKELTDSNSNIKYTNNRDWDRSGKRFGSVEKSKNELQFITKTDLEEGLNKTITWTRKNMKFIEGCINQHIQMVNP